MSKGIRTRIAEVREHLCRAAKSRLGANITALYVVQGMNYLAPIVVLPYLLRALGPLAYGSIVFAQAIVAYLRILTDFGFNFSATREISISRNDSAKLARVFWSTLAAKLALFVVGAVLFAIAIPLVPDLRRHAEIIEISSLSVAGSVLMPQWYFQGLERMRMMAIIQVASRVIMYGAIFIFVRSEKDVFIAAALLAAPAFLAGIGCLIITPVILPVRWFRPALTDIHTALSGSWHLFVSGAATSLYVNSNVFLIGLICGDYQVALYGLANRVALAVFGILSPVSQAIFPRASLLFGSSMKEGKKFLIRIFKYVMPLAVSMTVAIVIFAKQIVMLFGGERYLSAVPVLRIMAVLPVLLSVATLLSQTVMINIGLTRQLSRIYIAAGILSLMLLPPLANRFGAKGGALSLVIVESVGPLLMLFMIRRDRKLQA